MHANNPIKYTDPDGRYFVPELEANPSEEMYNLLAERDKDGDECPECEPGTMLNTVHVTDRRVWDFMKDDKKREEEDRMFAILEAMKEVPEEEGEVRFVPASGAITEDYLLLELFFGVEELALKGAAKFAVVPIIVKIGRPNRFRKGVVEKVWEKAKNAEGKVIDPKTDAEIIWDGSKPRNWDMGHKKGKEFKELREAYERGEISKKQFLDEYNNPDNYHPELPSSNRSNNQR